MNSDCKNTLSRRSFMRTLGAALCRGYLPLSAFAAAQQPAGRRGGMGGGNK